MDGPIALTGATGFVGRRVLALAAETGMALRVLARRPAALQRQDSHHEVIEGDLLDHGALERLTAGAAAVIHCAGAIAADRAETFTLVNVEGTRRLVAAARQAGTARFIHVSSLAAREPGLSAYALSKRLSEREVMDGLSGDRWIILRPPVVYGPGDPATLPLMDQLTRRTAWVPGSRRQRFSLLYVDDLARALIELARSGEPSGSIHHLHDGRPEGYAWDDLAEASVASGGRPGRVLFLPRLVLDAVARLSVGWTRSTGRRLGLPISPGKVRELYHRDWVCRHDLLEEAAPWRADVGLRDGLARTLEWYRDNGWLPAAGGVAKTLAGPGQGVRPG